MNDYFLKRFNQSKNVVDYLRSLNQVYVEFKLQEFYTVDQVPQLLNKKNLPFEIDGLIFMPENDIYITKYNQKILKWKEGKDTLDLLVQVEPNQPSVGLYCASYTKHKGEVKNRSQNVLFAKSNDPAFLSKDGKVVECSFQDGIWKFYRDRPDKSSPNIDWVAKQADIDVRHPVTQKDLIQSIEENYSAAPISPRSYRPHNNPSSHNNYSSNRQNYNHNNHPSSHNPQPSNRQNYSHNNSKPSNSNNSNHSQNNQNTDRPWHSKKRESPNDDTSSSTNRPWHSKK